MTWTKQSLWNALYDVRVLRFRFYSDALWELIEDGSISVRPVDGDEAALDVRLASEAAA